MLVFCIVRISLVTLSHLPAIVGNSQDRPLLPPRTFALPPLPQWNPAPPVTQSLGQKPSMGADLLSTSAHKMN